MNELNYLLIMPRFVSVVGEGYIFPIGIAYISAVMKEAKLSVFNLNLNHSEGKVSEIVSSAIIANKIDVVMIGDVSTRYSAIKAIVDCVYNEFPQVKTIIGGALITAEPETAMAALEYADIGIIGEGEITIVELCKALQTGRDLAEIYGVIYMDNGRWKQTKKREAIIDLDSLPFPDYDGFELRKYLELPPIPMFGVTKNRTFYILCSRSCPYQCTFCFHTLGEKYRQRSINNVSKEIEILVKKYNVKHIDVLDELFARNKDTIKSVDDACKQLNVTWSAYFRVDDIDEELIELLRHSNCKSMSLGLESADNRILKSMRKGITIEQIDNALQLAHKSGITAMGNFIFGDIEETIETAKNTLAYWENHKEYNIRLNFIEVYPGTYIYKYAVQNGIIKNPVQFVKDGCPNVNVSKLSDDDLSYIIKRIHSLSANHAFKVKDLVVLSTKGSKGLVSLKGRCANCEKENIWRDIKLFTGGWTISCSVCGQKHSVPIPDALKNNLVNNISQMLVYTQRIGLWGVNICSFPLFEENNVFKEQAVVFIDNSSQKQVIRIHGKKVYSPDDMLKDNLDTVVFFYPRQFSNFLEEIKRKYPKVKHFINVYDLLEKPDNLVVTEVRSSDNTI